MLAMTFPLIPSDSIKCLSIQIHKIDVPNFFLGSVYRPPNTDVSAFNSEMLSLMSNINKKNKLAFILSNFRST